MSNETGNTLAKRNGRSLFLTLFTSGLRILVRFSLERRSWEHREYYLVFFVSFGFVPSFVIERATDTADNKCYSQLDSSISSGNDFLFHVLISILRYFEENQFRPYVFCLKIEIKLTFLLNIYFLVIFAKFFLLLNYFLFLWNISLSIFFINM